MSSRKHLILLNVKTLTPKASVKSSVSRPQSRIPFVFCFLSQLPPGLPGRDLMGRVAPAHAPPAPSLLINAPATGDRETRINTAALNLLPALVALSQPLLQGHWGLEGQWADVLPLPARWGCSQRVSSKPATPHPAPAPEERAATPGRCTVMNTLRAQS